MSADSVDTLTAPHPPNERPAAAPDSPAAYRTALVAACQELLDSVGGRRDTDYVEALADSFLATARVAIASLGGDGAEAHLPAECRRHECGYYTHYLAYGGPDLMHEGYHAAEKLAERHFQSCSSIAHDRGPCSLCISYEQRLRA